MRQLLISEIPHDEDLNNLSNEIVSGLLSVGFKYVDDIMPTTKIVGDKRLLIYRITGTIADYSSMINALGLDWSVGLYIDAKHSFNFDVNGDPIMIDVGLPTERQEQVRITTTQINSASLKKYFFDKGPGDHAIPNFQNCEAVEMSW